LSAVEIIAVDQDPLGQQGIRVSAPNPTGAECWGRNMSDGSVAALLLARFSPDAVGEVVCEWKDLWRSPDEAMAVRDTWHREDLGFHTGRFSATLSGHSAVLLRLARPTP
jgi:alpha-galactosidase